MPSHSKHPTGEPEPIDAWIPWPGDVDDDGPLDYRVGEIITLELRGKAFDPAIPPKYPLSAYLRPEDAIRTDAVARVLLLKVRGTPVAIKPPTAEFASAIVVAREPLTVALGANGPAVEKLIAGIRSLSLESTVRLGHLALSRGHGNSAERSKYLDRVWPVRAIPGYLAAKSVLRTSLDRHFLAIRIPRGDIGPRPAWVEAIGELTRALLIDLYGAREETDAGAQGLAETCEQIHRAIGVDLGHQPGGRPLAPAISLAAATGISTSPALDGLA